MISLRVWLTAAVLTALLPLAAHGENFPGRPVRFVVPSAPGGSSDVIARGMSQALSKRWGQPVVVENRPGAAGIVGTDAVAKAAPDGYTWLLTTDSPITSNPHLYARLPYDPMRDLAPVTEILSFAFMIVAHPSLPADSVSRLLALAKSNPGTVPFGSFGSGSQPHIVFALLEQRAGASFIHVPYKGVAPALQATLSGEVKLTLASSVLVRGHAKAGRLKPLATLNGTRHPSLPEVPTLAEAGYKDISPPSWYGMFAPANTPQAIVARVYRDVAAVFTEPSFRKQFVEQPEFELVLSTPDLFSEFVSRDFAEKQKLIRLSGAKPE